MTIKSLTKSHPARLLITSGLTAIICGGLLSAFWASTPSRSVMWVSAFLVLVLGVGQLILGLATERLKLQPRPAIILTIISLYNLAGWLIILGTLNKPQLQLLVPLGSLMLLTALIIHLQLSYRQIKPSWRYIYLSTIATLIVSSLIGNWLSFS